MTNDAKGGFCEIDGERFYRIENYDAMQDFFMTLAASTDVWLFLWAQGGLTAGRKNSDESIFPYATSDKLVDAKNTTGPLSIVRIEKDGGSVRLWQPFESLLSSGAARYTENMHIKRSLYKNMNGSKIIFEEVNALEGLCFRSGWTSGEKYGLVRTVQIENLSDRPVRVSVLDGARNIMSAQSPANIQTEKSVLLDAYKKAEVDKEANLALFSLSSVVTDKAEPSECLYTNVSWFTTDDPLILSDTAVQDFVRGKPVVAKDELLGKRGECYILHEAKLKAKQAESWEQVFDVNLDASALCALKADIADRSEAWKKLLIDIKKSDERLSSYIAASDGLQECADAMQDMHHRANVMFNIMRGGLFADEGAFLPADFAHFVGVRNRSLLPAAEELSASLGEKAPYAEAEKAVKKSENAQLYRLFLEYLPLMFSRRHGDPSRPWNRFNIQLKKGSGERVLNFEGNWRDIFQNWEALSWSYPAYIKNMCAIFVNATTIDGFNPYRISRAGLDWEVPEPGNPWSQYGYWTDHQIIYLQKLLEFYERFDRKDLLASLKETVFSASDIPYKIRPYAEIVADARHSILFDEAKARRIKASEKAYGSDRRLVQGADGKVQLFSLATKLLQLVLAKALNHIPGAGIWINMQRPEWNDANNALSGYGASVVTACYLYRMLLFLEKLFSDMPGEVPVSAIVYETLKETAALYKTASDGSCLRDDSSRRNFTDRAGLLFEKERDALYVACERGGFSASDAVTDVSGEALAALLVPIASLVRQTVVENARGDGLFHAYNTVGFTGGSAGSGAAGTATALTIERLPLMLEGQVAVLSSGILNREKTLLLCNTLKKSALFEPAQGSYMLYPNAHLASFEEKNCIREATLSESAFAPVAAYLARLAGEIGPALLAQDGKGIWHFAADLRNAECLQNRIASLPAEAKPAQAEEKALYALYEKTFNHKRFTGRSGSFYAYEGLGCIYWHQVSKLLLAVQENLAAVPELKSFYDDVKSGLGYKKSPALYGAFPSDPYSHTPYLGGAKQPGMTGQVKEEIITRFGELGLDVKDGECSFNPVFLDKREFKADGTLAFTWCGTQIVYSEKLKDGMFVEYADGSQEHIAGKALSKKISRQILYRSGLVKRVTVSVK